MSATGIAARTLAHDAKPLGMPPMAALSDALVRGLDVRRPLRISRAIPREAFVAAADWHARVRGPVTGPIGGVRLVADDVEWSHAGPGVRSASDVQLLLMTRQPVRSRRTVGPGAGVVLDRVGR